MATILVVDDNAAVARMLSRLLETKGHKTIVATSGPQALSSAMGPTRPDLILLDLMMPDMDGLEVLRRLASMRAAPAAAAHGTEAIATGGPDEGPLGTGEAAIAGSRGDELPSTPAPQLAPPPVILFSAVDDPKVVAAAMKCGACDYWVKASFRFDELPQRLARHLPADPNAPV